MTLRALVLRLMVSTVLLASFVGAQTPGKLSGTVTDAQTGEQLIGVNVVIRGTSQGASTDVSGSFFVLNVPPGRYEVQASMLGYQKVLQRDVIVNSGKTTITNFQMTQEAILGQEVIVQAVRPDVELEKTSTSEVIRSDEVQQIAGMRDIGDVLTLAAEVTDGHFRGGRSGEELFVLQGMGITNPLDNSSAFMPIMSAVEEVEVITSGFGAQYGNAQSGVVNISMKEGKSDKWRTTVETRLRAPGRKHFGPSVFDPTGNIYLSKLMDPNTWKSGDPENNNQPYFSWLSNFNSTYARDTAVQVQVMMALWRLQMKRDLFRNYGTDMDYSVEGGTGGPIDENTRMFLAFRSNIVNPVFPTVVPDIERQVMGNISTDFGNGMMLRISGGYSRSSTNVFPSVNGLGFYNWLWDRDMDIQQQITSNAQLGIRWTHTLDQHTFYELKLNALQTKLLYGSAPWANSFPDSLFNAQRNTNTVITSPAVGPDLFAYLRGSDSFNDEKTLTVSLEGSVTSQLTKSHMLNAGVQANFYSIDARDFFNTSSTLRTRIYSAHPVEAALYAQDKMEFEGMIANVGLRLDVWDAQQAAYADQFNPFGVKDSAGNSTNEQNADLAAKSKPPKLGRLQPRIGISFPVSVNTVFHLNYGSFMQRPSFQYIVASTQVHNVNAAGAPITLGNPRLEPQVTNSYDIGITQGLGEGFTLDVSGYYKDVKNLIEQALFVGDVSYNSFINRDYADIRGFRVSLRKRKGIFNGAVNYQYGYATGKSATVSNAPPTIRKDTSGAILTELANVPIRDILLDFDRTHNLILTLAIVTDPDFGPVLFDSYPFGEISISSNSSARSGRPYTSSTNTKLINGARTPAEYNTNVRISKKIHGLIGNQATLYAEVFNLFDDRVLNYNYLFQQVDAGHPNTLIESYEQYPLNDPANGVLYWNNNNVLSARAFPVDQSFLIYSNQPRSFNFGLIVEF